MIPQPGAAQKALPSVPFSVHFSTLLCAEGGGAAPSGQPPQYRHWLRASVFVEEKNLFSKRGLTPPKQAVCVVLPVSPTRCLCLVPPAEGIRWAGEQRALVRPESAVRSCHLQLPAGTAAASPAPQASSRPDTDKPPLIEITFAGEVSGLKIPGGENGRNRA